MRRLVLVPLLIVLAVLAIGGGIAYYVYQNYLYYSTDDAQVNGTIVPVDASVSGRISALNVRLGDNVKAGQTIATLTTPASPATGTPAQSVKITSPIDGTILQLPVVTNQIVTPGVQLAQLTNLSNLNIIAYVDENALNNVKVGQQVDIHIDAYSDTSYTGHVQQIISATAGSFSLLPTEDNASGNFTKVGQRVPVIISLDSTGGKDIMPGMSAEVTIHIH
jgi:multidrug resistance efflux pump